MHTGLSACFERTLENGGQQNFLEAPTGPASKNVGSN